ncbi:hypothetical protein AB1Y20_014788 [Prymnesium parvum]|uniref:Uncharacterized protein n=1 Tax=Prymnesium parvum TaxID=97485 RepID=A0AB34IBP6_PRYPA
MRRSSPLLLALSLATALAARSTPAIGDALEFGSASPGYLPKRTQLVGVLQPLSSRRRLLDRKAGVLLGPSRRQGIVWWAKRRGWNPLRREKRAPFKVRLLKHNAAGVLLTLAEEGKVELAHEARRGERTLSVKLAKPRPWWRPV